MNSPRRITQVIAVVVGTLLCSMGILHGIINVRTMSRAINRGEIAERFSGQLIANVAASGLALMLPGVLLLAAASDLGRGKRLAWRIGLIVGVAFVVIGVAAFVWEPIPHVLIFTVFGALIAAPLLLWRKHFSVD